MKTANVNRRITTELLDGIEALCHNHDKYLKRLYRTVDAQQRYGKRLKTTLDEVTFRLTDSALGA